MLGDKRAVRYLSENSQEDSALDNALAITNSDVDFFGDLVDKALNNIRRISGYVNRYRGDTEAFHDVEEMKELIQGLLDQMNKKKKGR